MTLYEELNFEITVRGKKSDIKRAISAFRSGELDDFFDFSEEYIMYDDSFADADDGMDTEAILTTDACGIEIDEIEAEELLEVICKVTESLDIFGYLYDVDEEEYGFSSEKGDSYYVNSRRAKSFNDELDAVALDEEALADD